MDTALLTLGYRHFEINIPTTWDELTEDQYRKIQFLKSTSTDRKQMLFEMLMVLVPLQIDHLAGLFWLMAEQRKWLSAFNLATMFIYCDSRKLWKYFATDDVIDALPSIEWIFTGKQKQYDSKVPDFTHQNITYYGVRTRKMSGMVWKQMQHADQLISNFSRTKDGKYLTDLAAILYMPKDSEFNDQNDSINDRIALFADLDIELKYAIYCNYVQLRETFYTEFWLPQKELATTGRPDWEAVTLSVADLGALGTYKEVEKQQARTVMKYFEKKHQENKPQK